MSCLRGPGPEGQDAHQVRIEDLMREAALTREQPTIQDVLANLDPRDSDAAMAIMEWLRGTGRLAKVGHLDGVGYTFVWQEPKGSTRAGWTAGGTQGDRIVDDALQKAEADGAKRAVRGLCPKCFSAVTQVEGEHPKVDDDSAADATTCPSGGHHEIVS